MISEYAESLADRLSFDRSLSRRVRREVEDHLRETASADPCGDPLEAERRAIAGFGDPRMLAAEFAALSLAAQARKVGAAVVLSIAGIFVLMKARLAWYAAKQSLLSDDMRAAAEIVGSIDRYAFWLSIAIGIAAWAYVCGRTPGTLHPSHRGGLKRFLLLCLVATSALIVSVIGDGVLTGLRLIQTRFSPDHLIPLVSMAVEIACAGVLVAYVRGIARRIASTVDLFPIGETPSSAPPVP